MVGVGEEIDGGIHVRDLDQASTEESVRHPEPQGQIHHRLGVFQCIEAPVMETMDRIEEFHCPIPLKYYRWKPVSISSRTKAAKRSCTSKPGSTSSAARQATSKV